MLDKVVIVNGRRMVRIEPEGVLVPYIAGGVASTAIITDIDTIISTGFSATAQAAAINPNGPIMDLHGMAQLAKLKAQELKTCLLEMDKNVGAGADATVQQKITDILDSLD